MRSLSRKSKMSELTLTLAKRGYTVKRAQVNGVVVDEVIDYTKNKSKNDCFESSWLWCFFDNILVGR
jgi:hypothetical protein